METLEWFLTLAILCNISYILSTFNITLDTKTVLIIWIAVIYFLFCGNAPSNQSDQATMTNRKRKAEKFLEQLYHEISVEASGRWSANEIKHIKESVSEIIKRIISEKFSANESCIFTDRSKNLIAVGSMENGTKIIAPDEFDFIFVYPGGNLKGTAEIMTNDIDFGGFKLLKGDITCVRLVVPQADDSTLKARSLLDDFFTSICAATYRLKKEARKVQTEEGLLELIVNKDTIVQKGIATRFRNSFRWTHISSTRNALEISVDLVPAFRCKGEVICTLLSQAEPFSQNIIEEPKDFLVIPMRYSDAATRYNFIGSISELTPGHKEISDTYFRISPVEYEIKLMKTLRDDTKKKWFMCYIILKYLTDIPEAQSVRIGTPDGRYRVVLKDFECPIRSSVFSSYIWKQIIFRKVFIEKKQLTSIVDCFNDVTDVFRDMDFLPNHEVYCVDSIWFSNCNIENVHFKKRIRENNSFVPTTSSNNIRGMHNLLTKIETDASFNIDNDWRKYYDELEKILEENKGIVKN